MSKPIDLTGQKFGRLTAIETAGSDKRGEKLWLCKCDCGKQIVVLGGNLRSGHSRSCGCLKKELARSNAATHGLSRSLSDHRKQARIYGIWSDMKRRCLNPNRAEYTRYGGRGISVCDEWMEFKPFYNWAMANGYQNNLTLERINVNGNYEPGNCKWVNMKYQQNNRTNNRLITYNGCTLTITEWAEATGIKTGTLWYRLKMGWPIEKALTVPLRGDKHERSSLKKAVSS